MIARRGIGLTRGLAAAGWLAIAAAASGAAAPKVHTVVIDDMKFGPAPVGLKAGDTVRWVNKDIFRHTATARDGAFDVDLPPKATADTVVKSAGVIKVYCRFHPGMKVDLNVAN